ncbi:cation:proton antiporter [Synechococcus sp. CS-1325]|nr:cation:proton antiporter [Synechococcus sp. CS-1325]MCT0213851.1 cation:proton antiporter [Synechococcus sp. CS-1326]MCT0230753.1 cation:proton antiporter [Synechococcus sp. CS-1324]MCT0233427.1 cation:proton antiporter [Synechococcus sp. CS-1327]PZU98733.1 MAG: sodium:proton antiporter [Cyanobium sp.]
MPVTDAPERLQLLWGITLFSGALAQLVAVVTGLPAVVLLLAAGLVIGRSGLGLVNPLQLGSGLETVVALLVSLVLFDGGLKLSLPGDVSRLAVLRIVLVRLALALPAAMVAAHWLAGLSWPLAAVFSAIVLGTGPTVVTPLVQQMRLAPPLGEVLEGEGLVLEPFGAVLALLLLELVLGGLSGWRALGLDLVLRLGGGVLIGSMAGLLLNALLARLPVDPGSGLRLQLSLGILFLMVTGCDLLLPESGLPAAVAAGWMVGRRDAAGSAQLDGLIRQLAQLAISILFPLLAADLSWGDLSPLGLGGVACVLALMLAVRPVSMLLATAGLPLSVPQKVLLAWLAPRGIVTAAVASLFALRLELAGVPGAAQLKGLVFLTILMTVGIQGLTATPLARVLGLVRPEEATAQPSDDRSGREAVLES